MLEGDAGRQPIRWLEEAVRRLVIPYLDRADLIRMRRAIGRPKDLRRATELELLGG